MQVAQALALPSIPAFKSAVAENIGHWFQEFLHTHPVKLDPQNAVLPFGRFAHQLRKAVADMRSPGDYGVATGEWTLPCGLTASKAWQFIQAQLAQVSVPLMLESLLGTVDSTRKSEVMSLMRFATPARRKPCKALFTTSDPVSDPLQGLTRSRLKARLRKAWKKGTSSVHFFTTDLVRLQQKLPAYKGLNRAELAHAMADIGYIVGLAERAVAWRLRPTPEYLEAQARAEERRAAKLEKQRQRRIKRRTERALAANLAKPEPKVVVLKIRKVKTDPVQEQQPEAVSADIIPLEEAKRKLWFKLSAPLSSGMRRSKAAKVSGATVKANRRRKANYLKRVNESNVALAA